MSPTLSDSLRNWHFSHRFDREVLPLVDRHYSRQKPGTPQFVAPGKCIVLKLRPVTAVWVSSWPKAAYTKHAWAGAWVNTFFRRESGPRSSDLIREAIAITVSFWKPPSLGMVTMVDPDEVESENPGYCYLRAGFRKVGKTKAGQWVFQMLPDEMPEPLFELSWQEAMAV